MNTWTPRIGTAGLLLGPVAASLAAGWALSRQSSGLVFALAILVAFPLVLVLRWNPGVFCGLLVVAVLNGLPVVNFDKYAKTGSFRPSDVFVLTIFSVLAIRALTTREFFDRKWSMLRLWSGALILWWTVTFVRSVSDGIPPLKAALYGRDFLYFALLVPVLITGLQHRREIRGLLWTLVAGAMINALGQIWGVVSGYSGTGGADPNWFIHPILTNEYGGIPRIYSQMADAVVPSIAVMVGLALLGRRRLARLWAGAIAFTLGLGVLLQLARATYLSLAFGLVVPTVILFFRGGRAGAAMRRVTVVLLAVVFAYLTSSSTPQQQTSTSTLAVVSQRVTSGIVDLSHGSGTVGYRESVAQRMMHHLSGHWVQGLGFWHPDAHPVIDLPQYGIRNGDVGILNSLMTMGIVGTVLLYLPLLALLWLALKRLVVSAGSGPWAWLLYGATVWLVMVISSSLTLVTLFTVSGLTMTAAIVACTARGLEWDREPDSAEE